MLTTVVPGTPHVISLKLAKEMTLRYRQNRDAILAPAFVGQDILPLSETFSITALQGILSNPTCTSLRIYYGMDVNLKVHAILVGVNNNNEDVLPIAGNEEDESGEILEDSLRCPPICPPPSPLNQP